MQREEIHCVTMSHDAKKICGEEESSIWDRCWLMAAWLLGWISGHTCSGRLKNEPNESLWRSSLMIKLGAWRRFPREDAAASERRLARLVGDWMHGCSAWRQVTVFKKSMFKRNGQSHPRWHWGKCLLQFTVTKDMMLLQENVENFQRSAQNRYFGNNQSVTCI